MKKISCVIILAPNEEPMSNVLAVARKQTNEIIIVRGTSRGPQRNQGIRIAKNPYVLMVDRDCYLAPDYVQKLSEKMNEDTGAVCGLHIPHPNLPSFSKLEEYVKTAIVLNMGYTGAHGALYNTKAVVDAGGFNRDPEILADKGEALILNMKKLGYNIILVKNAFTYHLHYSNPRNVVENGLTCGTTKDTSIIRLLGRFFYSPISGIRMTKNLLSLFCKERIMFLLPIYWIYRSAVFIITGLLRRIM